MLLTANQPIPAARALMPAGRMLPRNPKLTRLSTIWHSPLFGPHVDKMLWVIAPSAVPRTIATTHCQKVSPQYRTPRMPTPTVANSMLGEAHVQTSWSGVPCRSLSGMNSTPPGSIATTLSP